jgi:membrane protein
MGMSRIDTQRTSWTRLLKETARDWMGHKVLRLSAALAYYSVFSIAPLLLICLAVAGWVYGPEAARGHVEAQLRGYLGAPVAAAVQSFILDASRPAASATAAVIGFVTLLLAATGVFAQLKDALNTIWDVPAAAGKGLVNLLRGRLLSFALVLLIGALLLASVVAGTVLAGLTKNLPLEAGASKFVAGASSAGISFGVVTVLFAAIFKLLPDARVQWRHVWSGALLTALLFETGKMGLTYYLGRESTTSAYGAAASVVVVLLWVYYASLILFFGAVFTKVRAQCEMEVPVTAVLEKPVETAVMVPVPAPHGAGRPSWILAGAATGLLFGLVLRTAGRSLH